jgi:hypothetical protein
VENRNISWLWQKSKPDSSVIQTRA